MILALHLTATASGHPYRVHAVGADELRIISQLGPAYVRPQDWTVEDGAAMSHRDCCRYGIPMRALFGVVLRMAECADTFIAHGMLETNVKFAAWCASDKLLHSQMEPWTRPGPERVCTASLVAGSGRAADEIADAEQVWRLYLALKENGAIAA